MSLDTIILIALANFWTRKYWISAIHPAETVPLILSVGIVIQSVLFIGAQAPGLSTLYIDGCAITSQFVFPGMVAVLDRVARY